MMILLFILHVTVIPGIMFSFSLYLFETTSFHFIENVDTRIILRILGVFSKPAIYLNNQSTVQLTSQLECKDPTWWFDGDGKMGYLNFIKHTDLLNLTVYETFTFGKFYAGCGGKGRPTWISIPYKLCRYLPN